MVRGAQLFFQRPVLRFNLATLLHGTTLLAIFLKL